MPKKWNIKEMRVPIAVTIAHLVVVGVFSLAWRAPSRTMPPSAIRATLIPAANSTPADAEAPPSPQPQPKPKPRPRPNPTSKPKPKPKPVQRPTKTKPKWRPRTAEEIRRGIKPTPIVEERRADSGSNQNNIDLDALRRQLNRELAANRNTVTTSGSSTPIPQTYQQQLMALLYQTWRQPSRSEVKNDRLRVSVQLTIQRSGRLVRKQIHARSGNRAMDQSVSRLLANLRQAPAFPAEMPQNQLTITAQLVLRR